MKAILNLILVTLISSNLADQGENPTCKQPIDKSAVTKEATDEAAKFVANPPPYTNEIYSSKVKSNKMFK